MYCIYGLLDPDTLELRYIGKTKQPEKRMKQHLYPNQLKTKTHRNDWIKSLLQEGKKPGFIILERNVVNSDEAEIRWIAEMRTMGARLVNGTNGGDGHKGGAALSEETKKRIGDAHKGQKRSPEAVANMKASQTYEWAQKRRETKMKTKKPNNVSGFVGVSLFSQNGKWRAYYMEDRKQKHIGYFETPQEAAQAYDTTVIMQYPDAVTNTSLGLL
jgi:hypothetical protein